MHGLYILYVPSIMKLKEIFKLTPKNFIIQEQVKIPDNIGPIIFVCDVVCDKNSDNIITKLEIVVKSIDCNAEIINIDSAIIFTKDFFINGYFGEYKYYGSIGNSILELQQAILIKKSDIPRSVALSTLDKTSLTIQDLLLKGFLKLHGIDFKIVSLNLSKQLYLKIEILQ